MVRLEQLEKDVYLNVCECECECECENSTHDFNFLDVIRCKNHTHICIKVYMDAQMKINDCKWMHFGMLEVIGSLWNPIYQSNWKLS